MNNDGLGAGRRSRKPRPARRFEMFGKTNGLEDLLFYKVSVNYDGFGAGVSVPSGIQILMFLKGLLASTAWGSVCRGSGAQEPDSIRFSITGGPRRATKN